MTASARGLSVRRVQAASQIDLNTAILHSAEETNAMTIIRTLAAAAAGTLLATSAVAQSAKEIGGASTHNLFLLEDVEDVSRTMKLAESDLNALHAVADWIKAFVVMSHKDL